MRTGTSAVLVLLLAAAPAAATDIARGRQLFEATGATLGVTLASCSACHTSPAALRAQIGNRDGGRKADATLVRRRLQAALEGAQAGAMGAKAQYRGVLTARDLDDLAAYIAAERIAALPAPKGSSPDS